MTLLVDNGGDDEKTTLFVLFVAAKKYNAEKFSPDEKKSYRARVNNDNARFFPFVAKRKSCRSRHYQ
jgi:hypothetical protein